jgi:phosphate transport system permease protein
MSLAAAPALSRARHRRDRAATAAMAAALGATVAVLVWILAYVAAEGLRSIHPGFFVQNPPGSPAVEGGGFYNGIVGTVEIVGIAFAMAAPAGILAAVYLSEYGGGRLGRAIRFGADVLAGVPTIVTGAFVYALWVVRFGFSGLAGAIALAVVMLPLVIRSAEEALRLVPQQLREASFALGAGDARTALQVVLPAAGSGITTGLVLAVARSAGETAPLLLTALGNDLFTQYNPAHRMSTLSLQIFNNAITGFRAAQGRAWAGSLTLIAIVLVCTLAARRLRARAGSHRRG